MENIKDKIDSQTFYSPDGCWYWTGAKQSKGYGFLRINGKYILTHRASYLANIGPIENNLLVCHRCDNRLCVNPDHLFLGTPKDNMDDMRNKGREIKFRGEQHYFAKLNNLSVQVIREAIEQGYQLKKIATYFNVHPATISGIKNNRTWAR